MGSKACGKSAQNYPAGATLNHREYHDFRQSGNDGISL
jgi:hypothetical protein